MKERLALCLLGAWSMGSVMPFVVAPRKSLQIDELLASADNASFRSLLEHAGRAPTRELLRFLSRAASAAGFEQQRRAPVASTTVKHRDAGEC